MNQVESPRLQRFFQVGESLLRAAALLLLTPLALAQTHGFLWGQNGGMQDLGTLGGQNSTASAINDHGEVVGSADTSDGFTFHAYLWTAADGLQDLGTLGGDYIKSEAFAINARHQVVGSGLDFLDNSLAFLWTRTGGMQCLGTLGGATSGAYGINSAGQVVGSAADFDGNTHAFLWAEGQGMQDLGTLGGS